MNPIKIEYLYSCPYPACFFSKTEAKNFKELERAWDEIVKRLSGLRYEECPRCKTPLIFSLSFRCDVSLTINLEDLKGEKECPDL